MLKLSKTAIRELSKMYRAVLIGAFMASIVATGNASATTTIDPATATLSSTDVYATVNDSDSYLTADTNEVIWDDISNAGEVGLNSDSDNFSDGTTTYYKSSADKWYTIVDNTAEEVTGATITTKHPENISLNDIVWEGETTLDIKDAKVRLQKGISTSDGTDTPIYGEAELGDTTVNGELNAGATTVNSLYSNEGITVGADDDFTVDEDGNIETSGNLNVRGDTTLGDAATDTITVEGTATFTNEINAKGGISTSDGENDPTFGEAELGNTTVNGNLSAGTNGNFTVDEDGNIETSGTLKAIGIDTTTNNKVKIGGTNYTTEITGNETVSGTLGVTGDTTLTGALNANGNVTLGNEAEDTITVNGTTTFNENVTIDSGKSLQLGGTSGNTVNAIDNGSTPQTSGGTTTMATVATVLASAENATYDGTKTNVKTNTTTIKGAIQDLDNKIGIVQTSKNGVSNSNTVGQNIDALNNKMGNVSELGTYEDKKGNLNKNGVTPTTVVQGLENLDQSIGDRTIQSSNGAINAGMATSLSDGLLAAGNQIGSLNYTSTRYVKQGMNLTEAVSALDRNIDRVDQKVKKMDKQMKSGFASMAAVAGLKPNARACNDTQIAIGGGYYRGTAGVALGGFHYVNDNLMLNLGAGYAGNQSATVSGGLTFGW